MTEIIDNRAHRIRTLKQIIRQLHGRQGAPPAEVKARLKQLVGQTDAGEIGAMEQELIADGMPVDEIRSMCDLHAEVLHEIAAQPPAAMVPPGHPVDTFRRENRAIRDVVQRARQLLGQVRHRPDASQFGELLLALRQVQNELMDVDKHYARKENLLFSRLEKYGISGPSKVMWAKDDEARLLLKRVGRILAQEGTGPDEVMELAETTFDPALAAVEGMIFKEENILLPMALGTLSDDDWADIWRDSPRYGWCLVEPQEGYRPPQPAAGPAAAEVPVDRALEFPTGSLTPDQLQGIFAALPLDLTFVDADDRVRYFSEGPDRVFARSRTILGRKVQNCHPPGSVHVVEKILSDFRSGQQDVAEFWINFRGRFVHIRYFAVRDPQRQYLGTLEVTQDLTRLRGLQGERRLLESSAP